MATQLYQLRSDGLWHCPGRAPLDAFVLGVTEPVAANTGYGVLGYTSASLVNLPTGDYALATQADADALAGKRVHGAVKFTGSNITLQGCEIVGRVPGSYDASYRGLINNASGTGNVARYIELSQWDASTSTDNSVYWREGLYLTGGGLTAYRNNIHDTNHLGYVTGGTHTIRGNYMHDPGFRTDDADHASDSRYPNYSHNDGTHIRGGINHLIEGNSYVMKWSTLTGMNSTVNPNPAAEQIWPNCHGHLLQAANNALSGIVIRNNWYKYATAAFWFTSNTYTTGNSFSITGNRITPDQCTEYSRYAQVVIDPTSNWTGQITFDATNVYSDDADTPIAVRGLPLTSHPSGNPFTSGTAQYWAYNSGAHTP